MLILVALLIILLVIISLIPLEIMLRWKSIKQKDISKKTLGIVHQNIIMALGIKFLVLILAALGYASMWAAVFADVGVAFLAILNAMRAMKVSE